MPIKLSEFPVLPEVELRRVSLEIGGAEEARQIRQFLEDSFPEEGALAVAAPQIGIQKRAFLAKFPSGEWFYACNPEILSLNDKGYFKGEGCLSFPNDRTETTERYNEVRLRYFNEDWREVDTEFKDIEAIIIQHEVDHLDGVLYKDRAATIKRVEAKIGRNDPCPECLIKGVRVKWKKCAEHNTGEFNGA